MAARPVEVDSNGIPLRGTDGELLSEYERQNQERLSSLLGGTTLLGGAGRPSAAGPSGGPNGEMGERGDDSEDGGEANGKSDAGGESESEESDGDGKVLMLEPTNAKDASASQVSVSAVNGETREFEPPQCIRCLSECQPFCSLLGSQANDSFSAPAPTPGEALTRASASLQAPPASSRIALIPHPPAHARLPASLAPHTHRALSLHPPHGRPPLPDVAPESHIIASHPHTAPPYPFPVYRGRRNQTTSNAGW